MSAIVQSVGWWCFVPQLLSPERFVAAAAEAGFAALDLVPPEHWRPVRDRGLAISSMRSHEPLEIGLNRRDQHERIERDIRTAIRSCAALREPECHLHGRSRTGPRDECWHAHRRSNPIWRTS
jgi:hydroxypyruvate isomerase